MNTVLPASYEYKHTIMEQKRFRCLHVWHGDTNEYAHMYCFQPASFQSIESVWHDFYAQIEVLKTAEFGGALTLLDYGELRSGEFFYTVKVPANSKSFYDLIQDDTISSMTRFQIWINMGMKIAELHAQYIYHGQLVPEDIYIVMDKQYVELSYPTLSLWYFKQMFYIDLSVNYEYALPKVEERVYRKAEDDQFALGQLLFDILYPNDSHPKSCHQFLQEYAHCERDLSNIIYTLLAPSTHSIVSAVLQIAKQYVYKRLRNVNISIGWHPDSQYSDQTIQAQTKMQFLEDTKQEAYLFTSFHKHYKKGVLHVVGMKYVWNFLIMKGKSQFPTDVSMISHEEIAPLKREQCKERSVLFNGEWTFDLPKQEGTMDFLQNVKQYTMQQQEEAQQRKQTRRMFANWEDVLRLQMDRLHSTEQIYAFADWQLENYGTELKVKLMDNIHVECHFEPGMDIVFLDGSKERAVGTFLFRDGQYIHIQLFRDVNPSSLPKMGDMMADSRNERIQIERQRKALQKFRYGDGVHLPLRDAILFPEKARSHPLAHVKPYHTLNERQTEALKAALGTEALYLLQGPPGTGKTTWITELILQIYNRNPMARILLASQSNVAIDHAFEKITSFLGQHPDLFRTIPLTVRIGNDKISERMQKWKLDSVVQSWVENVEKKTSESIWTFINSSIHDWERYNRLMQIFQEWKQALEQSDDIHPLFMSRSPIIVGATCMGSFSLLRWGHTFDWVIVDEAGRATHPEILIPTVLGRKVVYVGDHKQLPPVIEEAQLQATGGTIERRTLETSLFEELFSSSSAQICLTLNTQYRMHESISRLVSDLFYGETPLVQGKEDQEYIRPTPYQVLNWIRTDSHPEAIERQHGNSYYNSAEIETIQYILRMLEKQYTSCARPVQVAIITGYTAQRTKLREVITTGDWKALAIEIDTVDAFQGRECEIVIYSMVRNNPSGQIGFLRDERRMNVMLSRAREMLIIVGASSMATRLSSEHVIAKMFYEIASGNDGYVAEWEEIAKCT